jgi:sugar-specific transcriptional regulator TrmB
MKTTAIEIEDPVRDQRLEDSGLQEKVSNGVDELLAVLDKDVQHIQESLSRLNELRSLVVKHDNTALGKLLESIQAESDSYKCNELKRQSIRRELATAFGCSLEQMTLSVLEAELTGEKKAQVAKRKAMLKLLTGQLKKEYLSTSLLLSDCVRFNNVLLKSIFELGKTGTITYDSNGFTKRQTDSEFVNLRF